MQSLAAPAPRRDVLPGALLALAIALGWVAFDLVRFTRLVHPRAILGIAGGSLVALALAALVGAALADRSGVTGVVLASLVALSLVTLDHDLPVSRALIWLPRASLLLLSAWGIARLVLGRWPHSTLVLGAALGWLACAAKTELRHFTPAQVQAVPIGLWLLPLVLLALAFVRRPRVRVATQLAALGLLLVPTVVQARRVVRLRRPDLPPPSVTAAPGRPNVLLVVLDTVRADHLAPYGYGRVTTPALDAWVAEHATRWTEARSTAPWTLPSHASLFTGLYPSEHGATTERSHGGHPVALSAWPAHPLREDVTTLAERMRAVGYRTAAIVGNCFYVRHELGMDQGFEHFDDRRGGTVGNYLALAQLAGRDLPYGHRGHRDAALITDLALEWLDGARGKGAFLLFLNYFDAHVPYLPLAPYDRAFGPEQPVDPLAPEREIRSLLYDRELRGMDAQLARLLAGLEQRGLLRSTAVVITADHGEGFGEHRIWYHCWGLYDELVHVPLYVKPPGGRDASVCDEPIDGTGIHDLVLRMAGIRTPPREPSPATAEWYYPGDDTRQLQEAEARLGADLGRDLVSWEDGARKVIVASTGEVEVYDLTRDPHERDPLPVSEEQRSADLARARSWWAANPPPPPVEGDTIDAELLQQLRAVGYAGR